VLRAQAGGRAPLAAPQAAAVLGQRLGLKLSDGRAIDGRSQVVFGAGIGSRQLAQRLAGDAEVEWAVVDGRRRALAAPNDPLYADNQPAGTTPTVGQWYLRAPAGAVVSAIDIESAWALSQGDPNLVVAVLDTGVRPGHPDLAAKLLKNADGSVAGYDFISDIPTANDGNGRDADPSDPGDWITAAENASGPFQGCGAGDSSWHGTQTAALIGAATNNGIGMAGAAPNIGLLTVRVLGKCGGYDSDIIAGMRWAAGLAVAGVPANGHPARVLNLSLGSTDACTQAYRDTLTELGAAQVVVVAAAGNEGLGVGTPANCPGVIAVAGVRHTGTKVGYSNLGPEVTVSAPAGNCVNDPPGACLYPILTASDSGSTGPAGPTYTDSYTPSLGTSFSTPLVAGTVALMLSTHSSLTPGEVISLLKISARSFPVVDNGSGIPVCHAPNGALQGDECYCTTSTCGGGLLNAGAAVAAAAAATLPIPVIAAPPATVLQGASLGVDGSDSAALGGRSLSAYQWQISSGGNLAGLIPPTDQASANLTTSGAGTVTVQLTVTDSANQQQSLSQSFNIAAGLPSARIGASNGSPQVGDTLTLDGSASTTQGDAVLTGYAWQITAGSNLASFSGATDGVTASLVAQGAGSVTVSLTVTDGYGYSATSEQTLNIGAAPGTGGGGGGGGALAPLWALALLLGGALLRRPRPARR
jgi:serine protease